MPLQPEKLGPYRLERQVGRGGMGAVYVGVNEETGERAAIKVLAPAFAGEPNFRGRFAAEIETLKKLRHPNIVQLYGFGEEQGNLFYAMQLVEGDNLENEVRKGRHFDWREVIAIGLDVCKALKHAHDRGVIHRDLKPANLLRGEDGRILLSDFGIAKLFGGAEFTAAGGIIGTADYMAPEQAAGEGVTPRSDLYSLGASLFCLLAGRPPFIGRSVPDIIHQVRSTEAPLVSRFAPTTPVELESIIAKLLEKDPKKRIPTALALTNLFAAMSNTVPQTMLDTSPPVEEALPDPEAFVLSSETEHTRTVAADPHIANQPTMAATSLVLDPQAESGTETVAQSLAPGDGKNATASAPPTSRFTTVAAEELGKLETSAPDEEEGRSAWLMIAVGIVALAAIVALAWYATRPPSADQLFAAIDRLVEERDALAAADEIAAFLQRFPDDPRRAEVEEYRQEIEVARLERILSRRGRAGHVGEGMPLVERTYLDAMQTARSNPHRAVERLQSLIAVFGSAPGKDDATQACVELAKKQVERLGEAIRQSSDEDRAVLQQRLQTAAALSRTDERAAHAIWRGIVALYRDQPWAAAAVAEAEERLRAAGSPSAP